MQPDLSKYYGILTTGVDYFLEGQFGPWWKIGSGSFSTLNPQSLSFSGSYDVNIVGLVHRQGDVNLSVTVTGPNVGTIAYNKKLGPCRFQEDGDTLIIQFGTDTFKLSWWRSGVWIGGDVPDVTALWIGA